MTCMNMNMMKIALFIVTSLIYQCQGHSWITCTDYLEENGSIWNAKLCRAFPRHGWKYTPKILPHGLDTGYDHRPTETSPCFPEDDTTKTYDDDHPFAVYYPGQRVVITHPAKGHAADTRCTGKNVPDTRNIIYRSDLNVTQDPTLSLFRERIVSDLSTSPFGDEVEDAAFVTYPKPGYHNSPNYCKEPDSALATNAFHVPFLEPGNYIFMWEWAFTNENDLFSSCWDVLVVSNRGQRNKILQQRASPLTDLGSLTTTQKPTIKPAGQNQGSNASSPVSSKALTSFLVIVIWLSQ